MSISWSSFWEIINFLGVEFAGQWQPVNNLRFSLGYTFSKIDVRPTLPDTLIPASFGGEGGLDTEGEPMHIFNARSYLNLTPDLQLDTLLFLVTRTRRGKPLYILA